ncbi:hypothetical protein N7492_008456 [Penicillium capsulatum]|uniref:Uncharacterized protein n=1 Tax=Penicillium capsulatum TaxID=69766 RepID=A0A9W9LGY4_9EURO|nr:hypothetical protein N7492_008456 [Penicillium capsulatum]KAJ6105858.1 hypothetical protein N7512_009375 [Penicillium capsulatum]
MVPELSLKPNADARSTDGPNQGLAHSASFWSTASTEIGCSAASIREDRCDGAWAIQPVHFPWRDEEVREMFQKHDNQSIARLHRLGFLGKTSLAQGDLTPLSECWVFAPEDILNNEGASAARALSGQSLKKFACVPFEALIQQSLGLYSPEIKASFWEYEWLNAEICRYFIERRRYAKRRCAKPLANLKKRLEEMDADPLICTVVQNAYESVLEKKIKSPDLVSTLRFITEPLKELLQKPKPARVILQQLELLKRRFAAYCANPHTKWNAPFDTRTTFFDEFQLRGPLALAKALSQTDYSVCRKLESFSFTGGQDLKTIKDRWYGLCSSVKECLDGGVLGTSELFQFAQELCRLHNFLSMTAVNKGVELNAPSAGTMQPFHDLINLAHAFNDSTPGLYAVFEAEKQAKMGDFRLANKVISMCASYRAEILTSAEAWGQSFEQLEPVDAIVPSSSEEDSNRSHSNRSHSKIALHATSQCDVEGSNPQPRDDKMRYHPSAPDMNTQENEHQHWSPNPSLKLLRDIPFSCLSCLGG